MSDLLIPASDHAIPIHALRRGELEAFLARRRPGMKAAAALHGFKADAGQVFAAMAADGRVERVLFGLGDEARPDRCWRGLSLRSCRPETTASPQPPRGFAGVQAAVAWALGGYGFDRYKPRVQHGRPHLVVAEADLAEARRIAHACALARDMVNTPANDMGPLQIETIAREIAEQYAARITVIEGEGLHEANYPAVHAVGRAAVAARAPRMIEIHWGEAAAPLVAIVGKGVVFDTGGLDIKPTAAMRLMKKDMGGAAHALALARMVMDAGLRVRLVVLVPGVENAISGDAMRPGDIIPTRKGLTVEIGNTDAEGRLILADALARAAELEPVLTLDFATLTGAARVALGPQVVPFYTADDTLAADLDRSAAALSDPLWRMPLWKGYADAIGGDISDLKNDPRRLGAGRIDHGRPVPAAVRAGRRLGALRHLRLERPLAARLADGGGGPGHPRRLRRAEAAVRMTPRDPRVTLARADLADVRLEGLVLAARFAAPRRLACAVAVAGVRKAPADDAALEDQLLLGERFDVLEAAGGWAWGQARRDGYVGFVREDALAPRRDRPDASGAGAADLRLLAAGPEVRAGRGLFDERPADGGRRRGRVP